MKSIVAYIACLMMFVSSYAQNDKVEGVCSHCNMHIKDQKFASMAISTSGDIKKFDAIECLVNYLKEEDEDNFSKLLVADYEKGGKLIDAKSAVYLKSKKIASPMGAYLSAYSSRESAERIQKVNGGELYNWNELKDRFEDSRFGLLDHPTHHHSHPDAYAPIGIMGDHLHHKGGLMISARYMVMNMEGNLKGSDAVNDMTVYQDYMVAPQSMRMDMFMVGVMYAPSDRLTLMAMQNFQHNEMDLATMMGMQFTTISNGVGDLKISALYGLYSESNTSFHLNATISLPTGGITNQDDTPMGEGIRLPYPMQLGSGTVDLTVGGTYKGVADHFSWGVQPLGIIRTGESSEGYRWGNEYLVNTWVGYRLTDWLSAAVQLSGKKELKMNGNDPSLNPMMVTTADTRNTGFTRVNMNAALNFSFGNRPIFRDFKAGASYGRPLYQDVNGIQMKEIDAISLGLRYSI